MRVIVANANHPVDHPSRAFAHQRDERLGVCTRHAKPIVRAMIASTPTIRLLRELAASSARRSVASKEPFSAGDIRSRRLHQSP